MKKRLVFVMAAFLLVFAGAFMIKTKAADMAGKVVFHYQLWNATPEDYKDAGLWVWDTGTGGSQAPVTTETTDSFGGVYEINIAADAAKSIGVIGCRKDINKDSRWDYRETPDGENFTIDVTKITSGEVKEIHVYYFQGGYKTYYVVDPTVVNVLVAYYDAANSYEANLGVHSWGHYVDEKLASAAWASPVKVFEDGFKSPAGVPGKVAHLKLTETKDSGFLVYAGDDETKKTDPNKNASEYIDDWADLKVGDVRVLYITNKTAFYGADASSKFCESAFKFDFKGADVANQTGTYAVNKTTVFAQFTLALATKQEVVNVEKVANGLQTAKKDHELKEGAVANIVLHYQLLGENPDYSNIGIYTWVGGKMSDVTVGAASQFGGEIVVPVTADFGGTLEFVLLSKVALNEDGTLDWDNAVKGSSQNVKVEAAEIKDGATRVDAFITTVEEGVVSVKTAIIDGDKVVEGKVVTTIEEVDFKSRFTLTEKGTTNTVAIKDINFNKTSESTNEFVLQLNSELNNTKQYVLTYKDSKEDVTIDLDLDKEAPVITLLGDTEIKVKLGSKWDQGLWPLYSVEDDRDSNLDSKVYVKPGHGTLDTTKAGTYEITLCVEDTWGHVVETTFKFIVEPIEGGCKNASGALYSVGLLGLALVFFRRRQF